MRASIFNLKTMFESGSRTSRPANNARLSTVGLSQVFLGRFSEPSESGAFIKLFPERSEERPALWVERFGRLEANGLKNQRLMSRFRDSKPGLNALRQKVKKLRL